MNITITLICLFGNMVTVGVTRWRPVPLNALKGTKHQIVVKLALD